MRGCIAIDGLFHSHWTSHTVDYRRAHSICMWIVLNSRCIRLWAAVAGARIKPVEYANWSEKKTSVYWTHRDCLHHFLSLCFSSTLFSTTITKKQPPHILPICIAHVVCALHRRNPDDELNDGNEETNNEQIEKRSPSNWRRNQSNVNAMVNVSDGMKDFGLCGNSPPMEQCLTTNSTHEHHSHQHYCCPSVPESLFLVVVVLRLMIDPIHRPIYFASHIQITNSTLWSSPPPLCLDYIDSSRISIQYYIL